MKCFASHDKCDKERKASASPYISVIFRAIKGTRQEKTRGLQSEVHRCLDKSSKAANVFSQTLVYTDPLRKVYISNLHMYVLFLFWHFGEFHKFLIPFRLLPSHITIIHKFHHFHYDPVENAC